MLSTSNNKGWGKKYLLIPCLLALIFAAVLLTGCSSFSANSGGTILFISNRVQIEGTDQYPGFTNSEIYSMDKNGNNIKRLTDAIGMKQCASFSPDGKKIVYQYDSMKEPITRTYVMDADGKNPVRISNKANVDREPAWSPDGKWIVFESYRDPTDGTPVDPQTSKSGLYKMTSDGKTEVRLTQYATAASEPAWSPDGKKILFSSAQDGKYQIYIMNADGTNQTRLTKDNSNDAMSSWSPDGKKIVFSSDRGGKNNIYVMNADGSNQVIITHGDWNDGAPSWSPDGKQIVFCSDRDRTGERDLNEEIYRMQADGTNPVRLTNNPADDRLPRWKP